MPEQLSQLYHAQFELADLGLARYSTAEGEEYASSESDSAGRAGMSGALLRAARAAYEANLDDENIITSLSQIKLEHVSVGHDIMICICTRGARHRN